MNSCEYIFTTSYLMENFAIFKSDTAQQIFSVFANVFGDIQEVEFVKAMEMSKFEEDVEASNVINDPKCNKGPKCNNFWP